jgi:hypothetical protein
MYTQRKQDRRSFSGKVSFPLKTKRGCRVKEDRRSTTDRRLGNICLELDYTVGYGVPEYIADSPFNLPGEEDHKND